MGPPTLFTQKIRIMSTGSSLPFSPRTPSPAYRLHRGVQGPTRRALLPRGEGASDPFNFLWHRRPVRITRGLSGPAAPPSKVNARLAGKSVQGAPKALQKALTPGSLVQGHASSLNLQGYKPSFQAERHQTRRRLWKRRPQSALTSRRSGEVHHGHPLRQAPLARTLPLSGRRASHRHPHWGAPPEPQGEDALAPRTSHL